MKSPDNSQLDTFIRETLKTSEHNLPSVDWSEVEVLLRHEQKSIPIKVSRKTILIAGGFAIIAIAALGVFKITQYYSSFPSENLPSADTLNNSLTVIDTEKITVSDSISPITVIDTTEAEIDSATLAAQERKSDSLIAEFKAKETAAAKTIAVKESGKSEKTPSTRGKVSTLAPTISDIGAIPENILLPDTTGKNKPTVTKTDTPLAADSSNIKTPPAKPDSLK